MSLSDKQKLFAQEYLKDRNRTQAAIRAGYSPKSAHEQGCTLLKHPDVRAFVMNEDRVRFEKDRLSVDNTLQEIAVLSHTTVRDLIDEDGRIKPVSQWSDDAARMVAGIEVFEEFQGAGAEKQFVGYTKKIKLWPKTDALRMKAQHQKLLTEVHEHKLTGDVGDRLSKARERSRSK